MCPSCHRAAERDPGRLRLGDLGQQQTGSFLQCSGVWCSFTERVTREESQLLPCNPRQAHCPVAPAVLCVSTHMPILSRGVLFFTAVGSYPVFRNLLSSLTVMPRCVPACVSSGVTVGSRAHARSAVDSGSRPA